MNRMITLIPAYEPDEKLIVLLRELKDKEITSVVVNDGSCPSYNPIFEEAKNMRLCFPMKKTGERVLL